MKKSYLIIALHLLVVAAAGGQSSAVLHLTFLGDIMGHTANYRMGDFHDIYRGVQNVFKSDDLTFANLEFPVDPTRPMSGYPAFNGTRQYWKAAVDSGIEVFSLANNHAFDQGEEGIFQTLRSAVAVRESSGGPVYVSGIRGNPKSPFMPEAISVKGFRVGFMAVAQFINQRGPCPYVDIVDYLDEKAAAQFISFIRGASRGFDLFIVSYHGGTEYSTSPSPRMLAFFDSLLDNGVHIVFGHHPHVFQSYTLPNVKGDTLLCMPSMGNFISAMTWYPAASAIPAAYAVTGDSALVRVEVSKNAGVARISKVDAVPISNYRNAKGEMVVGKLEELAGGALGLSPAWTAYYKSRLGVMERLLQGPR